MPSDHFEQLLNRAAAEFGIEAGFWDIFGKQHVASAAVKQAILKAMGLPAEGPGELEQALALRARREWERLLPPVVVVGEGEPHAVPLNVPAALLSQPTLLTVTTEGGAASERVLHLQALETISGAELDGHSFVRKRVPLAEELPLGYHAVQVRIGDRTAET